MVRDRAFQQEAQALILPTDEVAITDREEEEAHQRRKENTGNRIRTTTHRTRLQTLKLPEEIQLTYHILEILHNVLTIQKSILTHKEIMVQLMRTLKKRMPLITPALLQKKDQYSQVILIKSALPLVEDVLVVKQNSKEIMEVLSN